ncbi:NAD(P)H-binding protein [Roseovarius aestuariivivens]|uniref:NAD(P)H-binding protein n=1 Tax=Roseovarius aestuariivivens TaxID=1888910 RepID=UPI0010804541|nr:NAD(P)H-binding protein [Roseovarius aestuariivivens]
MSVEAIYAPGWRSDTARRRVMLLGGSGTIGQAAATALHEAGHSVVAVLRSKPTTPCPFKVEIGRLEDESFLTGVLKANTCDVVLSCLASRSGAPADAWAVDHGLNCNALRAAKTAGVPRFVLLSAICVQRPKLEFQRAKLAFEGELAASGLTYSIVRPTAFFKSLSGQLDRIRRDKPFLVFGDGRLTACKPISDSDLARFLTRCVEGGPSDNRILPVGGPGPALTPLEQGEALFAAAGLAPKFRHVPPGLLRGIVGGLTTLGMVSAKARAKAELAKIGIYYATESMLVWNEKAGGYDADATPEFGDETLSDFYRRLASGEAKVDRGDHAVF